VTVNCQIKSNLSCGALLSASLNGRQLTSSDYRSCRFERKAWIHCIPGSPVRSFTSHARRFLHADLSSPRSAMNVEFKSLYPQTEEEETTSLHRTSPLALYVRRTRLNFDQLSFDQSVRWWDLFAEWCDGIVPSASTSASNQDGNSNRTRASDS
jgi:hypothetical protein